MAFFQQVSLKEDVILGFWLLEESSEELIQQVTLDSYDRERYKILKNESRKREFLAVRALLEILTGQVSHIRYHSSGKPFLKDGKWHIGITHTKGWAGLILGKREVALDMEPPQARILRLISRVCRPEELLCLEDEGSVLHSTLCWCAKETLFKLEGNDGVDFIENLRLYPFEVGEEGRISAEVIWEGQKSGRELLYFFLEGIPVVYGQR